MFFKFRKVVLKKLLEYIILIYNIIFNKSLMKVSIIIPVFNEVNYIEKVLNKINLKRILILESLSE